MPHASAWLPSARRRRAGRPARARGLASGLILAALIAASLAVAACGHATRSDADRVSYPTMTDGPEGPIGRPDSQQYQRADPL